MSAQLRGLTWDHPRATAPLHAARAAFAMVRPEIEIVWNAQPLSGFEAQPIAAAARDYDLVVFDHPHVGEVAELGLFRPVDTALRAAGLSDAHFVGPSLASYRFRDQIWGLPLDAACQVSCARADLLRTLDTDMPNDWAGVLTLGERALRHDLRLAVAFSGVHALMSLLTLCANQGAPLALQSTPAFPDRDAARKALAAMRALLPFCAPEVLDWNTIATQEAMCARDDLVYCPLVYGFAPYARRDGPRRLHYADLPGLQPGSCGSTIGGAGLGISARSRHPDAALALALFLIDARVQEGLIASNSGQPARVSAWSSPEVNASSGNFYSGTRHTIDQAWVRPRFNGYLDFQRAGGPLVEAFLRGVLPAEPLLDRLEQLWREALAHAR